MPESEVRKIVDAASHKLMLPGDGKLSEGVKAELVAMFAPILAERDEWIAALEAEVTRLGGSPSVVNVATGPASDDGYRAHLEKIAASHPDPTTRLSAADVLWELDAA